MTAARVTKGVEILLWLAALTCAAVLLHTHLAGASAQRVANQIAAHHDPSSSSPKNISESSTQTGSGNTNADVIGRMQMPQLGLAVPILASFDPDSLRRGVGHVPGTAFPGGLGTVGLVGHRDTYFRPLRHTTTGMEIQLSDASGLFRYVVDTTEIVKPEQVEVLAIRDRPELTLVTCYPFEFVGAAPLRFIVHAHLLSLVPEMPQQR